MCLETEVRAGFRTRWGGSHGCEKGLGIQALTLKNPDAAQRALSCPSFPSNPELLSGLPRKEKASATHSGRVDPSPAPPREPSSCLWTLPGTACFDPKKSADALPALFLPQGGGIFSLICRKRGRTGRHICPPYCETILSRPPSTPKAGQGCPCVVFYH